MKRFFLMCLMLVTLSANAVAGTKDTLNVSLNRGQVALVTNESGEQATYRVTDADMARWAKSVTKPRVVYRDRYVTGPQTVVHDTTVVYLPHVWWPGTRGFIPEWWPLLFLAAFLILLGMLLGGGWRGRDGQHGLHGSPGRDGRDGRDTVNTVSSVPQEQPWLRLEHLPEGTKIILERDRRPDPPSQT